MAEELVDFRGRLTPLADTFLEAESRGTGRDKQEILREIVHGWAMRRKEIHDQAERLMQSKGIAGKTRGASV